MKKKGNEEVEVQDGWKGHVIPFDVIQNNILPEMVEELSKEKEKLEETDAKRSEILDSLDEDEKEEFGECLNEDDTDFVNANVKKRAKEIRKSGESIEADSAEEKILEIDKLLEEIKNYKKSIKECELNLVEATKKAINELTDEQIHEMLVKYWVQPIVNEVEQLDDRLIAELVKKIEYLVAKYQTTLVNISESIAKTEKELCANLSELTGSDYDMKGIEELRKLLEY